MQLNRIGKWNITVLETGTFRLDGGAMMGSVPKVLWEKTNPPDLYNRISLAMRCILLDDGNNRVLIESGIGDKCGDKFKKMFEIKQHKHALSNTLSKYGYTNENITHIILTHLHFDHSGGCTEFDENGNIIPSFPNAKYYVSQENWDAALNPNPKDKASYLSENYMCLKEKKVLELVPNDFTILNDISTYVVNGHTFGQQLVKINSDNKTLVFCSDLIPLRSHIRLPWIMGYDLNASLSLEEKELFLDEAADKGWILFLYHDPDTVAVRIKKEEGKYKVIDELRRK